MIDIEKEFENSVYDYDKTINVIDKLPYSYEFLIQPNELSYFKTFNIKLSYLYDNLIYIYSRCLIPSYNVPTNYMNFIGVTGTNLGLYYNTNNSKPFYYAGYSELDNSKNAVLHNNGDESYLFVNCVSSINIIKVTNPTNVESITTIDAISGELKFQKINSLSILDNKFLCVSDVILNNVYKYDLETYFYEDNIFKKTTYPFSSKLFLYDIVGGEGGRYEKIKFDQPKNITSTDDLILVEDSNNKVFKLFNSNFNFVSYKTFISLYDTVTSFESIKFKNENEIYAVIKNGYYVINLDHENYQMTLNTFISMSAALDYDEYLLDIEFCKYDKNIIYVLTNKNFIKKWDSNILKSIGIKRAIYFGSRSNYKWFTTTSKNISSDLISICVYNSSVSANQILMYTDEFNLITSLNENNFKIYSKDEVLVKKEEWNQSWVYEKNIKKLVKNIEILKNTISHRFHAQTDFAGNLLKVEKHPYKDVLFFNRIDYDKKFSIGLNENFQSSAINRIFNDIYNSQNEILSSINGFYNI